MPFLTPDSGNGWCQIRITIPDAYLLRLAVHGALHELTLPEFWEGYGSMTVDEVVAIMSTANDELEHACHAQIVDDSAVDLIDTSGKYIIED